MALLVVTRATEDDQLLDAEKFFYRGNALDYLSQLNTECQRDGIYYGIEKCDPRGTYADVPCCDIDEYEEYDND